jgi:hypothetical protein
VSTKATDTTADAPAKTADMTATTAAGAETSDVTAAKAANATSGTPAKTPDVTAAKAPAASSAAATATAAGIGCDGDEGHHEEQHRGNGDASLQHRPRVTGQIRSCRRCLSRERTSAHPRTESY